MSTSKKKWLISTDLDGSLLDDHYQWCGAEPSLQLIRERDFPLILNSSKTFAEMHALVKELRLETPVVCENGGVIAIPSASPLAAGRDGTEHAGYQLIYPGVARDYLLKTAHQLREKEGYQFRGFADLSEAEVVEMTGLSPKAAQHAKCRHATEPIVWDDSDELRIQFTHALDQLGIRLVKGGRFYHIMGQVDKSDGLTYLRHQYQRTWPDIYWITIALGDSANDLAMLSAADIAGVIPDRQGACLEPTAPCVVRANEPGPIGWNQIMQQLFNNQPSD